MSRVFVLGAGPAGLALCQGLFESEPDVRLTLLEKGDSAGGLARTLEWPGYGRHDLGPHKIFSTNRSLVERVESLLPAADWIERPKRSRIWMRGHFLPYPPSLGSLLSAYGLAQFAQMVFDYAVAIPTRATTAAAALTFEDDLKARVGSGLYEALFLPLAYKLWGDPATLDLRLSRGRVQTPGFAEAVALLLGRRKTSNFEAMTFRYPAGGLQRLWETIMVRCAPRLHACFGEEVTELRIESGLITAIGTRSGSAGLEKRHQVGKGDFVFSTIPLPSVLASLRPSDDGTLANDLGQVVGLNDLLLVFLKIRKERLFDDSWIFVPDPAIAFHRVSEQESFDPGMSPGGSIVCCEFMSYPEKPLIQLRDEELVSSALEGLQKLGLHTGEVAATRVIRIPRSYPVYRAGYEPVLHRVLDRLDSLANFRTVGRQGSLNYIGTLDAMDIGFGAARWYANRAPGTEGAGWAAERERTQHYPVLD